MVARIRTISEEEATGTVKSVYEQARKSRGWVSNMTKAFSLKPELLRSFVQMFGVLMMGPSGLSRAQREMIAIVTSVVNECHY